jgi:hypothetical protein
VGELPPDELPELVGEGELPPLDEDVAPLPLADVSDVPPLDAPAGLAVDPDCAPPVEDPPPLVGGALPHAAEATSTKRGSSTADRDLFERGASMTGGLLAVWVRGTSETLTGGCRSRRTTA